MCQAFPIEGSSELPTHGKAVFHPVYFDFFALDLRVFEMDGRYRKRIIEHPRPANFTGGGTSEKMGSRIHAPDFAQAISILQLRYAPKEKNQLRGIPDPDPAVSNRRPSSPFRPSLLFQFHSVPS